MRVKHPVSITLAYLDKFKTPKGGYTKKQVEALGLTWPLTSGWKTSLVGTVISGEDADIFESEATKPTKAKSGKRKNLDQALGLISSSIIHLTIKDIHQLRMIEKRYFELLNKK